MFRIYEGIIMDNTKLQQLERRVAELEKYIAEHKKQQIKYPLDLESILILQKYFMRLTASYSIYYGGASGNYFPRFIGQQDTMIFEVSAPTTTGYTVNTNTDYLTSNGANFKYWDNDAVKVATTEVAPSPLVAGDIYYVINSDGFEFQLSASLGGAAIDITDTGSGLQFIQPYYSY
jgi:hypothetical protein